MIVLLFPVHRLHINVCISHVRGDGWWDTELIEEFDKQTKCDEGPNQKLHCQ